ncbi:hypothetical protein GRI43_05240 [Altererythrobacter luteolus]|uniref:Lipoyl-binding domain-containing protein n=1 Tax=Pontixanthobacter luteolus TaxID=295089 RepID=A0A6I4V117_9SPHN|nr:lipoyl domain-containing protein [Pontixanthobacter luteolus]MXP46796.1 hypothetical protein [Pontixanthobacter luteolus]
MKAVTLDLPAIMDQFGPVAVQRWLAGAGDEFEDGTPLVSLETEIAHIELNSPWPGKLTEILCGDGAPVAVGTALATIEVTDWVYDNMVSE